MIKFKFSLLYSKKQKKEKKEVFDRYKESIKIKVWFVERKKPIVQQVRHAFEQFLFPHLTKKCDKITQFSLSWIKNRRNCHRFLKFLIHFCILFLLAKRKICMGYYILTIWKLPSKKTEYSSFVSGSSMGNRDNMVFFFTSNNSSLVIFSSPTTIFDSRFSVYRSTSWKSTCMPPTTSSSPPLPHLSGES